MMNVNGPVPVISLEKPRRHQSLRLSRSSAGMGLDHQHQNHHNNRRRSSRRSLQQQQRLFSLDSSSMISVLKLDHRWSLASLENLICNKIPRVTGTGTGTGTDVDRFRGLSERCLVTDPELVEIADWLLDLLSEDGVASKLDASILPDIHAYIGLIRQWNGEYHTAQRAYISALWTVDKTDTEHLASLLYILGNCYGKTGQTTLMNSTLSRAMEIYLSEDATDYQVDGDTTESHTGTTTASDAL